MSVLRRWNGVTTGGRGRPMDGAVGALAFDGARVRRVNPRMDADRLRPPPARSPALSCESVSVPAVAILPGPNGPADDFSDDGVRSKSAESGLGRSLVRVTGSVGGGGGDGTNASSLLGGTSGAARVTGSTRSSISASGSRGAVTRSFAAPAVSPA